MSETMAVELIRGVWERNASPAEGRVVVAFGAEVVRLQEVAASAIKVSVKVTFTVHGVQPQDLCTTTFPCTTQATRRGGRSRSQGMEHLSALL